MMPVHGGRAAGIFKQPPVSFNRADKHYGMPVLR